MLVIREGWLLTLVAACWWSMCNSCAKKRDAFQSDVYLEVSGVWCQRVSLHKYPKCSVVEGGRFAKIV